MSVMQTRRVILPLWFLAAAGILCATEQFSGQKSFAHLEKVCSFGPRIAGTAAHQKAREYIKAELRAQSLKVIEQEFRQYSSLLDKNLSFVNIVGVLNSEEAGGMALSAHWDSRPIADYDPQVQMRRQPIVGANDGASGIALLLELARVLKANNCAQRITFMFFDAEDYGTREAMSEYCMGSAYMAAYPPEGVRFDVGINVDMIADKDLRIKMEGYSHKQARGLLEEFWALAEGLYPGIFSRELTRPILDDHVPFLQAGKPYIDLIDFEYKYWHTHADTPDKCSPRSLEVVGKTILKFVEKKGAEKTAKKP